MNWTKDGRPLLIAVVLAIATFLGVGLLNGLAYSEARDHFRDAMTLPGLIFAGLFYPEGLHTGRGTIVPVYLAMAGNFLAYVGIWRGVLAFGTWIVKRSW